MNSPQHIDPFDKGIRAHECIKHFPKWELDGNKARALRISIKTSGIVQPIQMTPAKFIVDPDSFERWRAAKELQLEKIPVVYVADDLAEQACVNAFFHRAHLSVGARVYLVLKRHEHLVWESGERRKKNLANPENLAKKPDFLDPHSMWVGDSYKSVAEALKVHINTVEKAGKLIRLFAQNEDRQFDFEIKGGPKDGATKRMTLREFYEPKLLAEQEGDEHEEAEGGFMGLAAALKAIGYIISERAHKTPTDRQPEKFIEGHLRPLLGRFTEDGNFSKHFGKCLDSLEDAEEIERIEKLGQIIAATAKARGKQLAKA